MAIIFAEGFDHYGDTPNGGRTAMLAGEWAQFNVSNPNVVELVTTQKRTGTHSMRIGYSTGTGSPNCQARRVVGAARTIIGMGLGVFFTTLPIINRRHGFEFRNASNGRIVMFTVQSDGAIGVYTAAGLEPALLIATDPVITAAAFNHIEVKVVIDNVVGEIEIRVNGIVVLHETDLNLGTSGCTQIVYGTPTGVDIIPSDQDLNWYIDDIVTWDDAGTENVDFVGPMRVETIWPVADTIQADWLKVGAADGYDCINEVPPDGDTTYLVTENAGDISEFELGTLPPETVEIAGVYIPTMARIEDAGVGNIKTSLVSGADVSDGADVPLTTVYTYWGSVHEKDPATDAKWTKSGLEAALLRVEKTV